MLIVVVLVLAQDLPQMVLVPDEMARQLPPTSEPRARDHGPDLQVHLERVTRIELALSAWEADVLPLNYTRK
jgi:hypothetical protein